MKVIFLDIDGVLNSEKELRDATTIEERIMATGISKNKVKLLKEIVDKTGASIVLSSSWRLFECDREKIKYICKINNINYLGETCDGVYIKGKLIYDRGAEIKKYIEDNNIKEYIVIDDEINEIKPYIPEDRIIETTLWDGLTGDKVEEAIYKLKSTKTNKNI